MASESKDTSFGSSYTPKMKETLFITKAGIRLKMSEVAIATALQYYHLFHINMPGDSTAYNSHLVAMATLFLASKAQEDSVRLSDLVNTCYYCLHSTDKYQLDVGDLYWQLKESVAKMELVLLRALRFKFQLELPHKYLLHHLLSLSQWVEPHQWMSSHVTKISWSLLQDTFHTRLNLTYTPNKMAVTVLYLAVKMTHLSVPSHGAQRQWWEVMCPGVKESDLQSLSEVIMKLYDTPENTNDCPT